MAYNIDLIELSRRESESVEWKENGDDKNIVISIVKTICAFVNDISNLGGGYVICGAIGQIRRGIQKELFKRRL